MAIDEVFPNPTVTQVIFQILFPNLFFMESKIGDFQIKIMKEFPQSQLVQRRQIIFAEVGEEVRLEKTPPEPSKNSLKNIWQFYSPKNYQLNVTTGSLDITSGFHKTYANPGSSDKFRDIINHVLTNFFEITKVPIISRLGLRYIDECPVPAKNNKAFKSHYNTAFPLSRFDIAKASEMDFKTVIQLDDCFLRYMESLQNTQKGLKLILDFDGWATDIAPEECLSVTDKLHIIISDEYERTIKQPVLEYMRRPRESHT